MWRSRARPSDFIGWPVLMFGCRGEFPESFRTTSDAVMVFLKKESQTALASFHSPLHACPPTHSAFQCSGTANTHAWSSSAAKSLSTWVPRRRLGALGRYRPSGAKGCLGSGGREKVHDALASTEALFCAKCTDPVHTRVSPREEAIPQDPWRSVPTALSRESHNFDNISGPPITFLSGIVGTWLFPDESHNVCAHSKWMADKNKGKNQCTFE